MKVALTGATGFIGSHVLAELREHGHEVTALVRDDAQAGLAAARGASPAVVDLYDRPAVADLLSKADGAIHTASPGDATSANLDSAVVDAVTSVFTGSGKPYLHIGGIWVYGDNTAITEDSPMRAPALVSWKKPIERRILGAMDMRGVVIISSVAYGDGGGGIPGLLLGSPRDEAGNLIMLGTGQQHWSTVHVADLAVFFRRALEDDSAHGYYVIGNGANPTVAELTEAAAVAAGAPGAVPGSGDEARARLGDYFAEVLLLDQGTSAAKARAELGWHPSRPSLTEEFLRGSYRSLSELIGAKEEMIMTSNEEIVRAAYRTAEGDVLDLEAWRNAFTEDGVFNNIAVGESYTGDRLGDVVTWMAGVLPDVHRELLRVHETANLVVAELLIQGTFLGPLPTPAGPVAPTGAKVSIPTADFFYLRDGKIETFNCYVSMNIMLAQMGVNPDYAAAVNHPAPAA